MYDVINIGLFSIERLEERKLTFIGPCTVIYIYVCMYVCVCVCVYVSSGFFV